MKTLFVTAGILTLCFYASGCASTNQQIASLMAENEQLQTKLSKRTTEIRELKIEKARTEENKNYHKKRAQVLERESTAVEVRAEAVRSEMEQFVSQVTEILQEGLRRLELAQYVGSEPIERQYVYNPTEKNGLLIDLGHPLQNDGVLIGCEAYLGAAADFHFCILRPEENGQMRVVHLSKRIAGEEGRGKWKLSPTKIQSGDYIGVWQPNHVSICFDNADTGNVLAYSGKIHKNATISVDLSSNQGRGKTTFSFGGYVISDLN